LPPNNEKAGVATGFLNFLYFLYVLYFIASAVAAFRIAHCAAHIVLHPL